MIDDLQNLKIRFFQGMTFALLACLAGCSGGESSAVIVCPQVAVVRALEKARIADRPEMLAKISRGEGECTANQNSGTTTSVRFEVTVDVVRIPDLTNKPLDAATVDVPYVVALVTPDNTVRVRQPLTARASFKKQETTTSVREPIEIDMPVKPPESSLWRVLIGMHVNESSLKYSG